MKYPGRIIKRGETDQAIVAAIAGALRKRGYAATSPAGAFDAAFKSLVSLFQAQNVDAAGRPLEVDGEVGSMTWGALFGAASMVPATSSIAIAALGMAISQLGVVEQPPGSNDGPQVGKYLGSVGLNGGYFWCMAFVHWCFQEAARTAGIANPFPRTGGCIDAWNRVRRAQPDRIITKAQALANPALVKPGHVFILDYGGGAGHTGFVRQSFAGPLRTVEGNANPAGSRNGGGVYELNRRKLPDPKLKGFIDFT